MNCIIFMPICYCIAQSKRLLQKISEGRGSSCPGTLGRGAGRPLVEMAGVPHPHHPLPLPGGRDRPGGPAGEYPLLCGGQAPQGQCHGRGPGVCHPGQAAEGAHRCHVLFNGEPHREAAPLRRDGGLCAPNRLLATTCQRQSQEHPCQSH